MSIGDRNSWIWELISQFWAGICMGTYLALSEILSTIKEPMYSFCSLPVEWQDQKTRKQAYEQQLPQALLTMPGQIPEAVKKQNNFEEHESAIQKAMEYLATWDQPSPPGQTMLANKYGVPRSMLTAQTQGHPSKLDSASKQQKIPLEELIVAYLQETACRGFPDTQKWCVQCANEILHTQSGNPTATVGIHWLGCFLHCHHNKVWCYWSTTLTTIWGGALNSNTVDHWFNLLQQMVTIMELSRTASSVWMKHAVSLTNAHKRLIILGQHQCTSNWPYRMRSGRQPLWFQSSQQVEWHSHQL